MLINTKFLSWVLPALSWYPNRELARERIGIEHINRQFKIFKILAERYRNRRRR